MRSLLARATVPVVFLLALAACSSSGTKDDSSASSSLKGQSLTIYTQNEQNMRDELIPVFENDTGVKANLVTAGTGELYARIKSEADLADKRRIAQYGDDLVALADSSPWAILPMIVVVVSAFRKTLYGKFVNGYTTANFTKAADDIGEAFRNTLTIGGAALLIIVVAAIAVSYVTVRRRNVLNGALDTMTMVPYVVPGLVIGIALLIAYNKPPVILSGTATIMVSALVMRRLPYTIRSTSALLYQHSPSVEEASLSLGASKFKTLRRVVVPMLAPVRHRRRSLGGPHLDDAAVAGAAHAAAWREQRGAVLEHLRVGRRCGRRPTAGGSTKDRQRFWAAIVCGTPVTRAFAVRVGASLAARAEASANNLVTRLAA
jgi:ABC-type glycerol-3-phosphate transport system permease component